jgi:GTP-binding protein Era
MSTAAQSDDSPPPTRSGFVALVGRPNAGKSTLMNRLVGEKLSIVTSKAQTTWKRVTGIHTSEHAQVVFLDTPGILEVRDLLQRSMLHEAVEALREADVVVVVVDASEAPLSKRAREAIVEALSETRAPCILVANKADSAGREQVDAVLVWGRDELGADVLPLSALEGLGVETLMHEIELRLPEGPFLYPADEIASQPVRFFVAELVRETVFEQFREEIPYSVYAVVEEYRESQDPVYIGVSVFVERNSQKRILIGHQGAAVRDLGRAAREKIETFIQRPVYLDLWIKVLPHWRRRRGELKRLGIHVPEEHEA